LVPTLAVLLALVSLAGCENIQSATGDPQDGGASNEPANVFRVPGIPVPDGAIVQDDRSFVNGPDNRWSGWIVMRHRSFSPAQMVEFMRSEMPREGWQETDVQRGGISMLAFSKGDRVVVMHIVEVAGQTEIDMAVVSAGR
jgi:hypothetical protein